MISGGAKCVGVVVLGSLGLFCYDTVLLYPGRNLALVGIGTLAIIVAVALLVDVATSQGEED